MSRIYGLSAGGSSTGSIDVHVDPLSSIKGRLKVWSIDNQSDTSDVSIRLDNNQVFITSESDDFTYELSRSASIVTVSLSAGGSLKFIYLE